MRVKRTEDELLQIIELSIQGSSIAPCRFSLNSVGNSSLVRRLREGEPINTSTMNKIKEYLLREHGIHLKLIAEKVKE